MIINYHDYHVPSAALLPTGKIQQTRTSMTGKIR